MSLKEQLRTLSSMEKKDFASVDLDALLANMVMEIGSPDAELRDGLIYPLFCKLILDDFLSTAQMQQLLRVCLDKDHLFYRIGERDTDSVFTRSFSALVLAVLLHKDKNARFLPDEDALTAIKQSVTYLEQEVDTRGFVPEKGWAHSIAHGADYLDEAIRHPLFPLEQADQFLQAITTCLFKDCMYTDEEDERLLFAVDACVDKQATEETMMNWITTLCAKTDALLAEATDNYHTRINIFSFLKSLYFRLTYLDALPAGRKLIMTNMQRWHRGQQ
ncbi:DUF2785 domain-containing protein [Virgibacillus sp. MG-45]|uniref:DUF2785 domain-containing protein n=1 Tax=Virgibacillus sp. MG-45 TaxID=3102791 RepID=UPI002ED8A8E6